MTEIENRARFLAEQATTRALEAKESWFPDGQLDYDIFTGLLADELESILRSVLYS
jgi:hypothetical protein